MMARVNEIRYVGYGVSDLAAEREFYRDVWRLREVGTHDDMVYFACEGHDEHHVVRLRAAEQQRIDVIALAAANRDDVNALHEKVTGAGCRIWISTWLSCPTTISRMSVRSFWNSS